MFEKINLFFIFLIGGNSFGIAGGLAVAVTLLFIRHHPIWSILIAAVVSITKRKRLKTHWRQKNWLPFFIALRRSFACLGIPVALIWTAYGLNDETVNFDSIDGAIAAGSSACGAIVGAFYYLLAGVWTNSRPAQIVEQITRGSLVITNLNED